MARPKKDPKNPALKNWLVSALRRASYRWPQRNVALTNARVDRGLYKCAQCSGEFKKDQIKLDHIEPIVSVKDGWTNWDDFINRLFCPAEGFQALCDLCHDAKTSIEDELRKTYKEQRKKEND